MIILNHSLHFLIPQNKRAADRGIDMSSSTPTRPKFSSLLVHAGQIPQLAVLVSINEAIQSQVESNINGLGLCDSTSRPAKSRSFIRCSLWIR